MQAGTGVHRLHRHGIGAIVPATKPTGLAGVAMGYYAAVLAMPLVLGFLIAATVLLINELRERSQRRRKALHEARRLDSLSRRCSRPDRLLTTKTAVSRPRSARTHEGSRITSKPGRLVASQDGASTSTPEAHASTTTTVTETSCTTTATVTALS